MRFESKQQHWFLAQPPKLPWSRMEERLVRPQQTRDKQHTAKTTRSSIVQSPPGTVSKQEQNCQQKPWSTNG